MDIKRAELAQKVADTKHRGRDFILPIVAALAAGIFSAGAAVLWKNSDFKKEMDLATRAVEKDLSLSREKAAQLQSDLSLNERLLKKSEEAQGRLQAQVTEAAKASALKERELDELRTRTSQDARALDDLHAELTTQGEKLLDLKRVLLRVSFTLNATDEKLSEAKRAAQEHEKKIQELQEGANRMSAQDGWLGQAVMQMMLSGVATQGHEAAQKAARLTEQSYAERISAVNELLKDARARHLLSEDDAQKQARLKK